MAGRANIRSLASLVSKPYWAIRHWFWDRREQRFVEEVAFYLADNDRLYVHLKSGGPATILITPYPVNRSIDHLASEYNHSHVEGRG